MESIASEWSEPGALPSSPENEFIFPALFFIFRRLDNGLNKIVYQPANHVYHCE